MRNKGICAAILLSTLLPGCGGFNLWPFGEPASRESSRKPANAVEYQCAGGKQFYVRKLDESAVWLIAPDREIRLEKSSGAGITAYSAGKVSLELTEQSATLIDPPAQFVGCKRPDAKQ